MKILFAIKSMNNSGGGAERVLAFLCNTLASRGHEVALLTFDRENIKSFYHLDSDVKRIYLPIGRPEEKTTLRELFLRVFGLRKSILRHDPDVVVGFLHSMYFPLALSLLGTRKKVIASEHTAYSYFKARKLQLCALLASLLIIKTMTVLSKRVRDEYPAVMRFRMKVVPNPVMPTEQKANARGSDKISKVILCVGRLDADKAHEILINAFSKLACRYPQWGLRIVGDGSLRALLENRITQEGLCDRVVLPGTINDISQEYLNAHIFVLPSVYEGFGLATAEAMSYGLPVVGFSDCSGTNELIVDGQNGILVSKRSSDNLALALEKLMIGENLRAEYGRASIALVAKYDSHLILNCWEDLLVR